MELIKLANTEGEQAGFFANFRDKWTLTYLELGVAEVNQLDVNGTAAGIINAYAVEIANKYPKRDLKWIIDGWTWGVRNDEREYKTFTINTLYKYLKEYHYRPRPRPVDPQPVLTLPAHTLTPFELYQMYQAAGTEDGKTSFRGQLFCKPLIEFIKKDIGDKMRTHVIPKAKQDFQIHCNLKLKITEPGTYWERNNSEDATERARRMNVKITPREHFFNKSIIEIGGPFAFMAELMEI